MLDKLNLELKKFAYKKLDRKLSCIKIKDINCADGIAKLSIMAEKILYLGGWKPSSDYYLSQRPYFLARLILSYLMAEAIYAGDKLSLSLIITMLDYTTEIKKWRDKDCKNTVNTPAILRHLRETYSTISEETLFSKTYEISYNLLPYIGYALEKYPQDYRTSAFLILIHAELNNSESSDAEDKDNNESVTAGEKKIKGR